GDGRLQRGRAHLALQQHAHDLRLLLGGAGGVGHGAAQPVLAIEQVGDREQVVGQRAEVGRARGAVEPLLDLGERGPAHTSHRPLTVPKPGPGPRANPGPDLAFTSPVIRGPPARRSWWWTPAPRGTGR